MIENLITIFFLVLLVFSFCSGYAKGMIKMVVSFASVIISVVLTRIFAPVVADALKNATNVESTLTSKIYGMIMKTRVYDTINIPFMEKVLDTGNLEETIKNNLSTQIANAIINLLCVIVVFIVVLLIIKLIIKILDIINYIPVIGKINKLLGGVIGVLETVVIIWILFAILKSLNSIPEVNIITEHIKSSYIVGSLYNSNYIYDFFLNLLSLQVVNLGN